MLILTENGYRPFYSPTYTLPKEVLDLERDWKDAWNDHARKFNDLVTFTRQYYGRMKDAPILELIP